LSNKVARWIWGFEYTPPGFWITRCVTSMDRAECFLRGAVCPAGLPVPGCPLPPFRIERSHRCRRCVGLSSRTQPRTTASGMGTTPNSQPPVRAPSTLSAKHGSGPKQMAARKSPPKPEELHEILRAREPMGHTLMYALLGGWGRRAKESRITEDVKPL
jgi:hypothetical protein